MKTQFAYKIIALCVLLLFAGQTANAQTSVMAPQPAQLNYHSMSLLELAKLADSGDAAAKSELERRYGPQVDQPPRDSTKKAHDPNAPVLGTSKGLGVLPPKFKDAQPKPTKPSSPRSYEEMQKELGELAAKIKMNMVKIKAGTYTDADKKETASILKRVKELTAQIKIRKIADKVEHFKKCTKNVGEATKTITKRLTFVWTMNPAELMALAEKGGPKAQVELADRYEHGRKGFDKDAIASFSWMLKASNSGNAHAQYFTASKYHSGKGVAIDDAKAAHWLRKSAENGNKFAQFQLHKELEGRTYFVWGIFDKNLKEAELWLNKAAAQGFNVAISHKKEDH